ncbi:MAG: HAMP domain-containing histidine kinase [Clostridia bacterium]|nr:HAMP domain-containing histidine kinase [Clostridia bacterium]
MRNLSIVSKLFLVTALMFILFLGLLAVSQAMFFEKFYLESKREKLRKGAEAFSESYQKEQGDINSLNRMINRFIDEYKAQVAILDENGIAKFTNTYEITVETDQKQKVKIPLNDSADMEELKNLKLTAGSDVKTTGIFLNNEKTILMPLAIESNDQKWDAEKAAFPGSGSVHEIRFVKKILPDGVTESKIIKFDREVLPLDKLIVSNSSAPIQIDKQVVNGKISEMSLPTKMEFLTPYKNEILWSAIENWLWMAKSNNLNVPANRTITYDYKYPLNGENNVVFVKPIMENGKPKETIFVIASLQPVGEAVSMMKDYYLYVFLVAILFILALSFVYSKMVAKPLININHAAKRMAELDFSVECKVGGNDEIGSLSKSLNLLSGKLSTSLNELMTANEKLQRDIEKERALESMRKEFVSSVSHELKTPLGIITAFAEGIKHGVAENKKKHYIDVILDEAEKMNHLVLDMLDLSRLGSNAFKLTLENFCINELIHTTLLRFDKHIQEKAVDIRLDFIEGELLVFADEKRIEQVLVNLLSNAIRHATYQGFIRICLRKREDRIVVEVENSGEPIPETKLERIWDRFYRVEESRERQSGGSGLGLAIVKNILQLHKSTFGVRNTEGGVLFYFDLDRNGDASQKPRK